MKDLRQLDEYRDRSPRVLQLYGDYGNYGNGVFNVPSPVDGAPLVCIASDGAGWDHVSVSRRKRCPNWPEMDHVKRLFFHDNETVMQLHVPRSDHISDHDTTLHLWRPTYGEVIPRPPAFMVGGCTEAEALEQLREHEKCLKPGR